MEHRRRSQLTLREFARYAAVTAPLSVAIFYLMFFLRRELWTWRLALFAAIFGFTANSLAVLFRFALLGRTRRVSLTVAQLILVPFDFVAGLIAFTFTANITAAMNLQAFHLSSGDHYVALLLSGALSIAGALLFYVFHITQKRLRRSLVRIKDQELTERELELARTIQQRLLPPEHVSGDGYAISARNLAAQYVAGDFYDVFPLADGALGIVVADVAGKGIGASLIVASVKAVLPLVADGRRPHTTLIELNRRLHATRAGREFVAMAYGRYEPQSGMLELANAGLPDPYLVRASGPPEVLSVPGPRLPLAVRRDVSYEVLTVRLEPGERVVMFTDGLPEATTFSGEQVGYESLTSFIAAATQPSGDLINELFALLQNNTTPGLEDDWTALVLHAIRPVAAR